jgi:hypothetical protein
MGTPSWLYYLFGVLMLAVAAYCLTLLVLSVASNRVAGRDVEISHTFMGVAMAGMFVPAWSFGPNGVWELIFGALMVWFLVRSIQSVQRYGLHVPHALVHAAMSFAMLLMYWYPMAAASESGGMGMSMGMSSSSGSHLDAGLGYLLALIFFGSAIFTLASPNKGASHVGTHLPRYAMSGAPDGTSAPVSVEAADQSPTSFATRVEIPWLEDLSHVVMCIGMGFMLILMV